MCGCSKPSRQVRPARTTTTVITRNSPLSAAMPHTPSPPNTLTSIQAMDPERLRIEQLRREAIRRSFGG